MGFAGFCRSTCSKSVALRMTVAGASGFRCAFKRRGPMPSPCGGAIMIVFVEERPSGRWLVVLNEHGDVTYTRRVDCARKAGNIFSPMVSKEQYEADRREAARLSAIRSPEKRSAGPGTPCILVESRDAPRPVKQALPARANASRRSRPRSI